MPLDLPIDPEEVLGVGPETPLEQIRYAYRDKAKRHHPDAGGEAWTFRILNHSYEWLVMRRMSRRVWEEEAGEARRRGAPTPPTGPHSETYATSHNIDDTHARRAVRDAVDDTAHLVDIELFTIRYEVSDPSELLYARAEDRTLTCSLNVNWPSREHSGTRGAEQNETFHVVQGVFRSVVRKTRAKTSHVLDDPTRFDAWVSYPTLTLASQAFETMRELLHQQRLGVAQWLREVIVPKGGR
jgi:hypothetical protein